MINPADVRKLNLHKADIILVKSREVAEQLAKIEMPWLKKTLSMVLVSSFDDIKTMDEREMAAAGWVKANKGEQDEL